MAVLIVMTVLVGASCAGWARIHEESNSDKLWCAYLPGQTPPFKRGAARAPNLILWAALGVDQAPPADVPHPDRV